MTVVSIIILAVHYLLVFALCIYGAHRVKHALTARKAFKNTTKNSRKNQYLEHQKSYPLQEKDYPKITVQAPIFNERFVVKRMIDAMVALDYPKDKLQIQILDDSTDDSVDIARKCVEDHQENGVNIQHIHRKNRVGFKAGALQEALAYTDSELIAIFDADFIPAEDFLQKIVHQFNDPEIGMVQTRWFHLNTNQNLLTRIQSIMLDAHFGIEQVARDYNGVFFNFNGTAGVWRKQAILDAGGWRANTLTEDLDLSYRAQMKNWKFKYLHEHGCPSELPIDMCAFKSQQHRWAKGAIEVMKTILAKIWKSEINLSKKIEASFHLTGNFSYLLMLIDSLFFLLPAIHLREQAGWHFLAWLDIPLFFLASLSHAWFFIYSQKLLYGRMSDKLIVLPALLATSIGLAVNNGRAVLEALMGHVTEFVRTPKTGDITENSSATDQHLKKTSGYFAVQSIWADTLEVIIGTFYLGYLMIAIHNQYWIVVPFLSLFTIGFYYTGLQSLLTRRRQNSIQKNVMATQMMLGFNA